jgi:ferredoxin
MPKVEFVSIKKIVEVEAGTRLPDIVDQNGSHFPFGCRHGNCGTCRCLIDAGMENLNPMTDAEKTLFAHLTLVGKTERLGCQLVVNGDVKIRH